MRVGQGRKEEGYCREKREREKKIREGVREGGREGFRRVKDEGGANPVLLSHTDRQRRWADVLASPGSQ